jgi:hypothetical protein
VLHICRPTALSAPLLLRRTDCHAGQSARGLAVSRQVGGEGRGCDGDSDRLRRAQIHIHRPVDAQGAERWLTRAGASCTRHPSRTLPDSVDPQGVGHEMHTWKMPSKRGGYRDTLQPATTPRCATTHTVPRTSAFHVPGLRVCRLRGRCEVDGLNQRCSCVSG